MARLRPFPPLPSLPLSLSSLSPLIGLMDGVCWNFGLTPPLLGLRTLFPCIITHEHTTGGGFYFSLYSRVMFRAYTSIRSGVLQTKARMCMQVHMRWLGMRLGGQVHRAIVGAWA